LLENFDDEVREKLKVRDEASKAYLNRFERLLMQLTRQELGAHAEFLSDSSFRLQSCPFEGEIPLGLYELPRRSGEAHLFRLQHPLAEAVIAQAKNRTPPVAELRLDYEDYEGKVSVLEPHRGKAGWLSLALFTVESLDQAEDHLIFAAATDAGEALESDAAARLVSLPGKDTPLTPGQLAPSALDSLTAQHQQTIQRGISQRNGAIFEAEADKLEGWADDLKLGLEREIKELDRLIKEARRAATAALSLEEKLAGQKQIRALESQRNAKRKSLFDAQDQVDRQREELIASIECKLAQKSALQPLFTIRWRLV
jgi:adenine-specific DNA-methyltransferase